MYRQERFKNLHWSQRCSEFLKEFNMFTVSTMHNVGHTFFDKAHRIRSGSVCASVMFGNQRTLAKMTRDEKNSDKGSSFVCDWKKWTIRSLTTSRGKSQLDRDVIPETCKWSVGEVEFGGHSRTIPEAARPVTSWEKHFDCREWSCKDCPVGNTKIIETRQECTKKSRLRDTQYYVKECSTPFDVSQSWIPSHKSDVCPPSRSKNLPALLSGTTRVLDTKRRTRLSYCLKSVPSNDRITWLRPSPHCRGSLLVLSTDEFHSVSTHEFQ